MPQHKSRVARSRRESRSVAHALQSEGEELATVHEVVVALAAGGDPAKLLSRIAERLSSRLAIAGLLRDPDGRTVVVGEAEHDLTADPAVREVLATGEAAILDGAAVVPMSCEGVVVGALYVRIRGRAAFTHRDLTFLGTIASAAAVSLRTAGRLHDERTQRAAAEREVAQLRRYEEMFSHVSDGMAVLNDEGRVLAVNPAGCSILGRTPAQVRGVSIESLIAPGGGMEAALLRREIERGGRILSADLRVATRDGRNITLSVSAGAIQGQSGRAILTFRDVTESRALETELRKTKEFLESLIDATVDGIVAADLRGRVLLFNKGAERVTGLSAAEVVGKVNVGKLYAAGQATAIMRRLREARASGDGRIGPVRVELMSPGGEVVPVALSVAMVVEGGRETATVGVFRDLRDQLRVESELRVARERLAEAEKAAVVSELAGAAAHELNQPLTSVLGFSELLFRRTQEHERGREELAAILREAERMAQIVKKIGRITRYETTAYVGQKRIVDLDRASDPPPAPVVIIDTKP